jgi:ribosomal protein S18 acetylase RimI-like enzyme
MQEITFRQAEITDWGLLFEMEKAATEKRFYFQLESEDECKEFIAESTVFFLMSGEKPIGIVSYKTEGDVTHINGLIVLPEYRRQGVAKSAMEKVLSGSGNRKFSLTVHPDNIPALMLYLRLGFVITRWQDDCFGDGEPRLYLRKYDQSPAFTSGSCKKGPETDGGDGGDPLGDI